MNRNTHIKRHRRGIVGIEAAIVMIAFVIVAAALAFVVLNMGFFTTQQTRQVIQRGLGESASALEVDGTLVANVNATISRIKFVYVPLKLSTGQYVVDLTPGKSIVAYWSPQRGISIANTYLAAVLTPVDTSETLAEIAKAMLAKNNTVNDNILIVKGAKGDVLTLTLTRNATGNIWNITNGTSKYYVNTTNMTILNSAPGTFVAGPSYTVKVALPDDIDSYIPLYVFFERFTGGKVVTVIAWLTKTNEDIVLDPGEKVLMLTYYNSEEAMPQSYDTIKFEVRVPIGAPLTIERSVPPSLTQGVVDLG